MAGRRSHHTDSVREKIQTSMLVNFLEKHVQTGNEVKKTQISAAIALLRKTIPDLQSIEGNLGLYRMSHEERLAQLECDDAGKEVLTASPATGDVLQSILEPAAPVTEDGQPIADAAQPQAAQPQTAQPVTAQPEAAAAMFGRLLARQPE